MGHTNSRGAKGSLDSSRKQPRLHSRIIWIQVREEVGRHRAASSKCTIDEATPIRCRFLKAEKQVLTRPGVQKLAGRPVMALH